MTDAAPRLGSEARKRCISSLQVTYHQEIRKPVPRLGESPFSGYPENRWSSVVHEQETPGHINTISSYSCVPVHQSLEGACLQERRLEPSPEEQDFYPPPPPPLSVPSNSEQLPLDTLSQQHAVHHSCGPTPPPLPCYQATPRSPLFGKMMPTLQLYVHATAVYDCIQTQLQVVLKEQHFKPLIGLEDGLRHRVNVEIENFRASIQEIVREQFASQRHQLHTAPPTCCSDQHNCTVKVCKYVHVHVH